MVTLMLGEVLSLTTAFLWAGSTIISASVLKKIDPLNTNALRTLFAAISMLPLTFAASEVQNPSRIDPNGILFVIIAALIGFGVGDTCLFKSITLIGVSRSYTIAYIYPFFTMVLATLFLGESFHLRYFVGTAAIFVAIANVMLTLNNKTDRKTHRGSILAFSSSILYSLGTIIVTLGLRYVSVVLANVVRFPVLAIFLLLVSRAWRLRLNLSRRDLTLLALSGILGITIAGLTFLYSIRLIGAARTSALSSSAPVWASLMSILFLREKVTLRVLASSVVVVIGIYFLT